MAIRSVPQDGDVVVRADRREGTLAYVLLAAHGVDQLLVRTRHEAVEQAVVFAKRGHVDAWLTDQDGQFVLLENFRVVDRPETATMPASLPGHDAALNRIRAEFLEMPGLCLTRDQAQRLCGVERVLCQRVLDRLVDTRFLYIKTNGAYARLSDGADMPRPHPAKVAQPRINADDRRDARFQTRR